MKVFWKEYKDKEWQGPIECEHITFHVQYIYLWKRQLAHDLIRTLDLNKLYKLSIETK